MLAKRDSALRPGMARYSPSPSYGSGLVDALSRLCSSIVIKA